MSNEVRGMRDFHSLEIWKKSHSLTLSIYEITAKQFPNTELFALTSQLRRAVSSIPINIAEGCGRKTNADFSHFLQMSIGSSSELEYEILLAKDLNYISEDSYNQLSSDVVELRKMIIRFQKKLE